MSEPRYTHDCAKCKFLGKHDEYDLYFCDKWSATVIARFGSDWGDYLSGMSAAASVEPLGEALKRAYALGHVTLQTYAAWSK